ncbi:hypothetical protein DSM112329_04170 [Paraconexibacter sp. AEG42_29]|uniref:Zinc ABC transporter substrate-binding protein n=1 Tax=Paraconexibacter sp. AEG42_29 TaxID=2997339 RepID=A0AAU7B057_9ACTN
MSDERLAGGHPGTTRPPRALLSAAALVTVAVAAAAPGCGSSTEDRAASGATPGTSPARSVAVVATTTQVGDIVRAVGGSSVEVTQLLAPNTDPHDYEPRPKDVRATAGADVVFTSGDDLDHWMEDVVKQSGGSPATVDLAEGLPQTLPGEDHGHGEASEHDPHWWHDPRNVEAAVGVIAAALVKAEPAARGAVERAAAAYVAKVRKLDAGITACFDAVPAAERKLVTDHDAFGYFARRYGITVVGAVIPSQTTQAQPSAAAISRLARVIRAQAVKAVFPESSVNARLARAIAKQTGATAGLTLYGDTLGPEGSPGATYLTMERANADAMIKGFTGGSRGCEIAGL